ncbi:MAG: class I adenylate-forming enzyme family protein [Dethiobacteria bacterium]|jgi:acyl-CoA synthetase (AMP-forming)/AMP-acid ligase II|nr:acyl--CoA ligase [Bacillota bacterium]HOP69775.1 class I adenylate-forming enzyme family protein [Bacillota bacterium]HPT34709.1 class I adenylate-forming enzyme family protein [Bacillota bacterium]HPZ65163.1 class I adenylate-forming enzyme family protein [Bacillota bacterium]HQD06854.1 class I adenylate-forming enzyme family protein [Bacillota bacterium]
MENAAWKLPLLNSYVEKWARERPDKPAMIQHEDGKTITYRQFNKLIDFFALRLLDMGIEKGDRVATMLVLVPEHIILMYACFKIGAIIAPLDVRLKEMEVVRDLEKIKPKAFFFLGNTPVRDFREVGRAVKENCPYVRHLVQFTPDPKPGELLEGAISITEMMAKGKIIGLMLKNIFTRRLEKAYAQVNTRTPALIIFTTGTTGEPKPAVMCHENIIIQNEVLNRGVQEPGEEMIMLVNLPPSHVGCVTEQLMTTFYTGGTTVLLRIFDPKLTLEAIQKHKVTVFGQIPTQYRLEWALAEYDQYDLSSLKYAIYGGSAVDSVFLTKLSQMAPYFGTGMGMTETAGIYSFTPKGISVEEMTGQVGMAFEDLAPITIRKPMREDGYAGEELPLGETGHICVSGPIVFLGYYNMPEETAKAISKDGILYTGDMGYFKDMGSYKALYLAGRQKFVIKQKGYQVFPDEVQDFIAQHPKVDLVDVVGVSHKIYDEGIFAFVRPKKGVELTAEEILEYCAQGIAAYKRPQHVEIWPADKDFPLTRVAKVDKKELKVLAEAIVEKLRQEGRWDAAGS